MEYRDAGPQPAHRTASGRIKSILLASMLFALVLVLTTGAALAALPASPQPSNLTDKGSPGTRKPVAPAQAQPDVTCATLSFATAVNYPLPASSNATYVALGDFNRDGIQDLATANSNVNNVSIFLGNSSGGFGAATNFGLNGGAGPFVLAVGDFNADGKQDLASANYSSNNVSVLLGNGSGGFGTATNFGLNGGAAPNFVAVGDFNADGKQDLVTTNADTNNGSVLLGTGTGSFGTATNFGLNGGTLPYSVAVGDFNADGKQDLVTTNGTTNNVSILLGTGSGSFNTATNFGLNGAIGPDFVAVGDFNGDGKQDLVTANPSSINLSVLLGTGTGSFGTATNFGLNGASPYSVAVGDLNGDGKQDLATANYGTNNVSVLLGTGSGSFGTATNFGLNGGGGPYSVAVGDFNADGKQDLVTANGDTDNVSVLLSNCAAACDTGYFSTATNFGVNGGIAPDFVAVGDFNGDGKQDLATANANTNNVSILLGTGSGSFGAATNFGLNGGTGPNAVAVGDFNGDGKQDLVTSNGTNNISILLGTGTGSFNTATNFGLNGGRSPDAVAVGDFNGDGKQDLVTANATTSDVSILLGTGTGSFGTATNFGLNGGTVPTSVAVGDFNGDGKQDLVTANINTNNISVLLGTGTGSFNTAINFGVNGGTLPDFVAVGDFNGDGKQDLATANSNTNNVSVLLGTGTGSFNTATNFGLNGGTAPGSVAVGDFNGDGKQDLATANGGTNDVSILLGTGTGSFNTAINFGLNGGTAPGSVAVGDFNGDGKQDLVTANSLSDNVSVLLGICSPATPTPTATPTAGASCPLVTEGFESGLGQFVSVVPTCVPGGCGWTAVNTDHHSGAQSAFAPDLNNVSDQLLVLANPVSLPAASSPVLSFWHRVDLESTYDGGVLEFSTDGGSTWTTSDPNFISGGYNAGISNQYQNPIGGRNAWSGIIGGAGVFVHVQVNLSAYAGQNNFKFRFREANDSSNGGQGWWVDDVTLSYNGACGGTPTSTRTNTPTNTPTNIPGATNTPTPACQVGYTIVQSTGATIVPGTTDTGNHTDDGSTTISLPFPVLYYGASYSQADVGSNGILAFGGVPNNTYQTSCLPAASTFLHLFPFWADQTTAAPGKGIFTVLTGTAPNRTFYIEWRDCLYGTATSCLANSENNYEVALHEGSSTIDVIYGAFGSADAASGTRGAQQDLYHYSQYSCATGATANTRLTYTYGTCGSPTPVPPATYTNTPTIPANSTSTRTPTRTATTPPGATNTPTSPPHTTNTPTRTATHTALPTTTACTLTFADVLPSNTFYSYVRCLACRGIINGYPCGGAGEPCDGNNDPYFRPGNNLTRGQLAKIVSQAAGLNGTVSGQSFQDVPSGNTFYLYIERLYSIGAIGGYPCGGANEPCGSGNLPYYRPGANVTRGQLTKIVSNAAGFNNPAPSTYTFADVPVGSTFHVYVERLLLNRPGVMGGYPCGGAAEPCDGQNRPYFRVTANLTRGQTSKIVGNTFFPNCQTP